VRRVFTVALCAVHLAFVLVAGQAHVHVSSSYDEASRGIHFDHAHIHEGHGHRPHDHHAHDAAARAHSPADDQRSRPLEEPTSERVHLGVDHHGHDAVALEHDARRSLPELRVVPGALTTRAIAASVAAESSRVEPARPWPGDLTGKSPPRGRAPPV
jgi:hypothetical protein